jgi:hypothetical protein
MFLFQVNRVKAFPKFKDTAKWESSGTELANPMSACGERKGNGKEEIYPLGERKMRASKICGVYPL